MSTPACSVSDASDARPAPPGVPVLYSFRRCPYAMRARLALAVSGQRVELREVVLRHKPAALLQASPKATVPVLVLPDGDVLEQSLEIMLWALRRHDPAHWLEPTHGTLQEALALIAECDGPFKQALDRCKYPERHPDSHPAAAREQAHTWLQELEQRLRCHAWLLGEHATLADMALLPFMRQFAAIDAAQWLALPCPGVQAWLQRWLEGPLQARSMDRHAAWAPGATPVFFPPA